jgi:Protein of unknown function (DUF3148)
MSEAMSEAISEAMSEETSEETSVDFPIGSKVRVTTLPAYVKTAEPKPMLRPPHVIHLGEEGTVLDRRPGDFWGVRFASGAFLMESQYLEAVND